MLEIVVPENAALSQTVIVNPDGTVDFPALQGMPVDGITLSRFREIVVAQLSRYTETTPLVLVRFSDSYPIRVTVLGQVALPGMYPVANTVTLQGAIGAAGGFIAGAQLSKIKLIRTEGQKTTQQVVDMETFYLNGDPSQLPRLKDGDTVVVPGNPLATGVKVLGRVERPGNYDVFFRTTVLDVLFMAGGPTDDANLKKIKIGSLSGQGAREIRINFEEMLDSKDLNKIPIVVPGDVVYIPEKKITWRKFAGIARDLAAFATLYLVIQYSKRD